MPRKTVSMKKIRGTTVEAAAAESADTIAEAVDEKTVKEAVRKESADTSPDGKAAEAPVDTDNSAGMEEAGTIPNEKSGETAANPENDTTAAIGTDEPRPESVVGTFYESFESFAAEVEKNAAGNATAPAPEAAVKTDPAENPDKTQESNANSASGTKKSSIISEEAMEKAKKAVADRDPILGELVSSIEDEMTKGYVVSRVIPQMTWYSAKSRENKKKYTQWMTASIIMGGLIPVISVFSNASIVPKVLLAALGAGVTGVNAFMNLQHYNDLWQTYRNTREALLRTLYAYFNGTGKFGKKAAQQDRDALLIKMCEEEIARENGTWRSILEE